MTVRIFTIATVPEALAKLWLQHLRAFDIAYPGCHFDVAADAPDVTLAEAVEMVRLNPDLSFKQIFTREKPGD